MDVAESFEAGETCGDAGGRTADDRPCERPAGWGVAAATGRCRDHAPRSGRIVGHLGQDEGPRPPDHLSEPAAGVWRELHQTWDFSPTELIMLEEGLSCWDRARYCRQRLAEEGFVVTNPDSGHQKRSPLATELSNSLSELRLIFNQLNVEPPEKE